MTVNQNWINIAPQWQQALTFQLFKKAWPCQNWPHFQWYNLQYNHSTINFRCRYLNDNIMIGISCYLYVIEGLFTKTISKIIIRDVVIFQKHAGGHCGNYHWSPLGFNTCLKPHHMIKCIFHCFTSGMGLSHHLCSWFLKNHIV